MKPLIGAFLFICLSATCSAQVYSPNKANLVLQKSPGLEQQIHQLAQKYAINEDLALRIMWCESHYDPAAYYQNKNKKGEIWTTDYGYWQISSYWWRDYLKEKGWDIEKKDDNLEAGFYLLSTEGSKLWDASKVCQGT